MSFKDLTPEQRKAMAAKSAETRRAKKAERDAVLAKGTNTNVKIDAAIAREGKAMERKHAKIVGSEDWLESGSAIEEAAEQFPAPEIVYGEIEETQPEPAHDERDESPFGLFLASLDAETRELLDNDELRVIYDAQVAKAYAEKKAAKKKTAAELAAHAARMEAGLIPMATIQDMETAKRNAELVRFTVELPPAGDNGEVADIGLRIDQRVFLHGHTYTLPRAQADTFREMIYRAREMELTFKGQNRRMRQYMQGSMDSNRWHIPLNEDGSLR